MATQLLTEHDIWPGEPATPFRRLWAEVRDMAATPAAPVNFSPVTYEDEVGGSASRRDGSSSWTAILRYRDSRGRDSERMFRCMRLKRKLDELNVVGWCYEREAVREFRVDRIIELADAQTGELFDPANHFEQLRARGALNCDDMILTDLARVLTFMARCDGDFRRVERQAIVTQIERYTLRFDGCERAMEAAIAGIDDISPDGTDLMRAVKRFSRLPDGARICRFLLDSGAAVIDADGRHSEEETSWAFELSSTLKSVVDRR